MYLWEIMDDIGEIFTVVVTLAVAVLGGAMKAKEAKTKKLVRESKAGQEPVLKDELPFSGRSVSTPKPVDSFEEGQRMLEKTGTEIQAAGQKPKRKKLDIDKKKLVIYSELLKPKFDE